MRTSEVTQAVLSAAAGHQNAMTYAATQEERIRELYVRGRCAFLIHASPLVPLEVLWSVTGDDWRNVIAGSHRQHKRKDFNLHGSYRQPSVEGIVSLNNKDDPLRVYEVHRTGYIGAMLIVSPHEQYKNLGPYFWGSHSQLFLAFADLCEESIQTARSDRPYLLQATITNAQTAVLNYNDYNPNSLSKPLQRRELKFPPLRRDSGQSFQEAVTPWMQIFQHAFGVE
jgi:hypothetical protein